MPNLQHIKKVTSYQDINDLIFYLAGGIEGIFGDNLTGFYLTGSLSYGDFDEGRSDIDLTVVLKKAVSPWESELIKKLHKDAGKKYAKWSERLECSYIPEYMLKDILPPKEPRPYFGAGVFYPDADYGNEWIINQYFLCKSGITLIGPDFKTLTGSVDIKDVQMACRRDLYKEWVPKIADRDCLKDSHLQSYVVLNLCRILYALVCGDAVSKTIAATWAKKEYPEWSGLIEAADGWHYGIKMNREEETTEFIRFAVGIAESLE